MTRGKKRTEPKPPCSIDGCENIELARGWCSKHYSRWQRGGDPTYLAPVFRGDPLTPVVESRFVQGRLVHFTVDNRAFVDVERKRGGEVVKQRRYGQVFICEGCKRESFCKDGGAGRFRFCSPKCSGPAMGHAKLGRSKSPKPKSVIDTLDRMLSALTRSEGACVNCGSAKNTQCAHGFSRRYRSARWDRRNVFCLCQKCHMYYTFRPLEWDDWLRERWGEDLYAELRALAQSTEKVDLDAVRDEIAAEIRARGITMSRLPKSVLGWAGVNDEEAA